MLVQVELHPYGPRVRVLGCRVHHFHTGIALVLLGARMVWRDRRDLLSGR